MRYVHLGRTGLRVSRLCLGTMNFGRQIGEPESHAVLDRETPWEEIWQAMETLTGQGRIRYAGSSNVAGWHLARAQAAAELDRIFPPVGTGGPGPEAWAW